MSERRLLDEFDGITSVERRLLDRTLEKARKLDPYTRGLYAECLVAEALPGAVLMEDPIAPSDLQWRDITIAVRSTGARSTGHTELTKPFGGSWSFGAKYAWLGQQWADGAARRCWADVVVLAKHDGFSIQEGWTFYVLPDQVVETWPAKVLRPSTVVAAGYPPMDRQDLSSAVVAAKQRLRSS